MKNQILAAISVLTILTACSASKSSSPAGSPKPESASDSNFAPDGALTLDGGDVQLTYNLQQIKLNELSEKSPTPIGLFYKVFRLQSERDLTIALDSALWANEKCQKEADPGVEIQLTEDNKLISDLKPKATADIKAGVEYRIRLYFKNFGACEKVNYVFGLMAYEPKTQKLAAPPAPNLPGKVVCITQDQKNDKPRDFLFDFGTGRQDRPEIFMMTADRIAVQEIFTADKACGLGNSFVQCDPTVSFDGNTFTRSLDCSVNDVRVSTGQTFFNLKTGKGHFTCRPDSGTKGYDLQLRECKVQP